jgi:hypothetical protein
MGPDDPTPPRERLDKLSRREQARLLIDALDGEGDVKASAIAAINRSGLLREFREPHERRLDALVDAAIEEHGEHDEDRLLEVVVAGLAHEDVRELLRPALLD